MRLKRPAFSVVQLCQQRRLALYKARDLFRFIQDHIEEMNWLEEKQNQCVSLLENRDLSATTQLRRTFKVSETYYSLFQQCLFIG